jgi:hypothetical protein
MWQPDPEIARAAQTRFIKDLAGARTEEAIFDALFRLSDTLVPVRLWTVMTVDLEAGLARRAYTNMPDAYPVSGTKPIIRNDWFDIVHGQQKSFVANTLGEIAAVFPDHELIGSLGCASVLNLPVFQGGELLGTVNLLDVEGHFTPDRVRLCEDGLARPALTAMLATRDVRQPHGVDKSRDAASRRSGSETGRTKS